MKSKVETILGHSGADDFRADFPRRWGRFALSVGPCRCGRHLYVFRIDGFIGRIEYVRLVGRLWWRKDP